MVTRIALQTIFKVGTELRTDFGERNLQFTRSDLCIMRGFKVLLFSSQVQLSLSNSNLKGIVFFNFRDFEQGRFRKITVGSDGWDSKYIEGLKTKI